VDRAAALARLQPLSLAGAAAVWISDGVRDAGSAALAADLAGRGGGLRYVAAEGEAPRLLAPGGGGGELAARDVAVTVRSLPAPGPRAVTVRASAEDGAVLARETVTLAPGAAEQPVRLKLPTELRNRIASIAIEGEESAGGVLLVDERWRRRPVGIAALGAGTAPPRRRARAAEAQACRSRLCRCRAEFAGRGGRRRQVDRGGRAAAPFRRAAPCRAARPSPAGAAAPRRAHAGRRAVVGKAGEAGAVRARQPVRRAQGAGRRHRVAPGARRARPRTRRQDLGAA